MPAAVESRADGEGEDTRQHRLTRQEEVQPSPLPLYFGVGFNLFLPQTRAPLVR